MGEFLTNYGVEILLSVLSILFGIFVSYVFYRLQRRDVISAQEERVRRAIEELMSVFESCVINKQVFSKATIRHLIAASERAHRVVLGGVCTPTSLLQDVSLELQKSRHLDVAQKAEYAEQIVDVISQTSGTEPELPTSLRTNLELLAFVEEAIQSDNQDAVVKGLDNLKSSLERLKPSIETSTSTRSSLLTETLSIGLAGVLVAYLALTDFFSFDTFEGYLEIYLVSVVFSSIFILGTPQGRRTVRRMLELVQRKSR